LTYSYNYQPIQFSVANSSAICLPSSEQITGTIIRVQYYHLVQQQAVP